MLGYKKKTKLREMKKDPYASVEIQDPAIRYIDRGTPLSQMSDRYLPSPCEVKGDQHLLLLPFY